VKLLGLAACFVAAGFGQSNDCDSAESCQKVLEANRRSSLAHYRVGEIFFQQGSIQSAANEFRSALDGDLDPGWIEVWSHINLGKIFDSSGQRDRAMNEYQLAKRTKDNTRGALDEAAKYSAFAYAGKGPQDIPENLKAPAGEELLMRASAEGDQIYSCDGSKWTLSGPEATLFNGVRQVGSHFAGPTWKWSDGSQVMGKPVASATLDADSIPWLLLTATNHAGDGVMKNVSTIERLHTKGGIAPASGCDVAHKDEKTRVHYTADYYFFSVR
jgi:hypothetical protein